MQNKRLLDRWLTYGRLRKRKWKKPEIIRLWYYATPLRNTILDEYYADHYDKYLFYKIYGKIMT